MMALLKALWKLRPPAEPESPGGRLVRRWREKRLLGRLGREWPGGFTLHRTGDLVNVPSPLDARGRHALLHPPHVHPAVLGFLQPGSVVIDIFKAVLPCLIAWFWVQRSVLVRAQSRGDGWPELAAGTPAVIELRLDPGLSAYAFTFG